MKITRDCGSALALPLILVSGLVLRSWGIDFGYPYILHQDEIFEVRRALQLGTGSYDFTRIGKGGLFYILFIEYGIYYILASALGVINDAKDFAILYLSDPAVFHIIGRITSVLFGSLTLYFVYRLGTLLNNRNTGLLAALFLSINPMHVEHSHYSTVDIMMVMMCVCTFQLLHRLLLKPSTSAYIWVGVTIAVAAMTKLPGIALLLPFVWVHVFNAIRCGNTFIGAMRDRRIAIGIVAFAIAYCIGTPALLANYAYFRDLMVGFLNSNGAEVSMMPSVTDRHVELGYLQSRLYNLNFYLLAIVQTMTPALSLLTAVGIVVAIRRSNLIPHAILVFMAALLMVFVFSGFDDLIFPRYVLPIVSLLVIFAALGLQYLSSLISPVLLHRLSVGILTVIACISPLHAAVLKDIDFTREDTRVLGAQWIHNNIAQDQSILLEGFVARINVRTIPLKPTIAQLDQYIDWFKQEGQYGKALYFELEKAHIGGKRYPLYFYTLEAMPDWDMIEHSHIDYMIVTPDSIYDFHKFNRRPFDDFYHRLQHSPHCRLIHSIKPIPGKTRGPVVEIYKFNS